MQAQKYITHSLEEFNKIANNFAKEIKVGDIVLLNGDLGAGKTSFVREVLKTLGVSKNITSPTFTFMKEYNNGNFNIYHYDLYKISSEEEVYELGIHEFLYSSGLVFIEWNKFKNFNRQVITINIYKTQNIEERIIEVIK